MMFALFIFVCCLYMQMSFSFVAGRRALKLHESRKIYSCTVHYNMQVMHAQLVQISSQDKTLP